MHACAPARVLVQVGHVCLHFYTARQAGVAIGYWRAVAGEVVSLVSFDSPCLPSSRETNDTHVEMSFHESVAHRRYWTLVHSEGTRPLLRLSCPLDFNGCNECCICGNGTREHALRRDAPHARSWRTDERLLSSVDKTSLPGGTPSDQAFPGKVTCATANTPTHWHGYAARSGYMFCR